MAKVRRKTPTVEKDKPFNPESIGNLLRATSGVYRSKSGQIKSRGGAVKERSGQIKSRNVKVKVRSDAAKSSSKVAKTEGNVKTTKIEVPTFDVKTAVEKAIQYANTFFPNIRDIQLEEVEFDESKGNWNITLSFPSNEAPILFGSMAVKRKFKIFKIDAKGNVQSMKIREI